MIIFFGPAGSGKSVQGQFLAARMGWRWLSAGQMLRDSRDPELLAVMQTGELAPAEKVNRVMADALARAANINQVIIDGFPRELEQAQWLVESQPQHGRSIGLVVVLDVPREELLKRLELRGRMDDTSQAIDERLAIYQEEVNPILDYLKGQGVAIERIDGNGSVGEVHDRIYDAISSRGIV